MKSDNQVAQSKKSFIFKSDSQVCLKVIFIGNSSVGKTSIIQRFLGNEYNFKGIATVGVACDSKVVQYKGQSLKLQLWDTAGQERFRSLTKNYYRGCDAVVIVFDVSKENSFEQVKSWIDENCDREAIKLIVGNKSDLKCMTSKEDLKDVHLVSAKENSNIEATMNSLVDKIMKNRQLQVQKALPRRKSLHDNSISDSLLCTTHTFRQNQSYQQQTTKKIDISSDQLELAEKSPDSTNPYRIIITNTEEDPVKERILSIQQYPQRIRVCGCFEC